MRVPIRVAAVMLLVLHAGLLAWAAARQAPTYDEVAWLPAGICHWQLGRFDLGRVNPPLPRMIAALPVLAVGAQTDWTRFSGEPGSRAEFAVGRDFMQANGPRSFWLFTLARWASIPFSLLAGWVCYSWGTHLYGRGAGLMSLVLWCFSPIVLANAGLVTADVPSAALGLTATYSFWRYLHRPRISAAVGAGVLLGLAELTKTTLLAWYLVWPMLWAARHRRQDTDAPGRVAKWYDLLLIAVISLYVMNLGYWFEGSFTKLDRLQFVSHALAGDGRGLGWGNRFSGTALGELPLPLPVNHLLGIDQVKAQFELGSPTYLRGRWKHGGWWYYYVYALVVKTPLGTWLLAILALAATMLARGYRADWRDELTLLLPPCAILVFVSSQTGFATMRYLLPAAPFAFIWMGKLARAVEIRHRVLAKVALFALSWTVTSSLAVYPHSLAYFNELGGGPLGGPAHLVDSNIDWGQDLLYLKRWIERHPGARRLHVAYSGLVDPRLAGIEFKLPKKAPAAGAHELGNQSFVEPGWYAISVNVLRGLPAAIPDGQGGWQGAATGDYAYFRDYDPVARAGYTIYIYHFDEGRH
ncbi:MAG: glycosyltransferase family 39 protein [Pirellulales bacterium]